MQQLGLLILTAKGQDSIPGWGTKIPIREVKSYQKKKKIMALHVFLLKLPLYILYFQYCEDVFHISISYCLLLAERKVIKLLYLCIYLIIRCNKFSY